MKGKDTNVKTYLRQQLLSAIILSLLFGLGWGFGLPATSAIDNTAVRATLQTLFILLTAFQGLFIFIVHCMYGRKSVDVRREWKKWYYLFTCRRKLAIEYSRGTLTRSTGGGEKKYSKPEIHLLPEHTHSKLSIGLEDPFTSPGHRQFMNPVFEMDDEEEAYTAQDKAVEAAGY